MVTRADRGLEERLVAERALWARGLTRVAGVDEAGLGPLAGPVVAAAVVFPPGTAVAGVDDSKALDPGRRERLAVEIRAAAADWALAVIPPDEVDRLDVYRAGLAAMRRALDGLREPPEHVLLDGRAPPDLPWPHEAIIKGDAKVHAIGAASILAKVHRDALLVAADAAHPGYGFAEHKGYATATHLEALGRLGPCPIHRLSFAPVAEVAGLFGEAFARLARWIAEARSPVDLDRVEMRIAEGRREIPLRERKRLAALLRARRAEIIPAMRADG
jgi:ribonuclease HII